MGGALRATPTSSPAPPPMRTPTHSVAMPTPLLQAVYDRTSQQPLYILQSGNGPTLIPVQGIQMAPPQQRGGVPVSSTPTLPNSNQTIAIPTSLSLDQIAAGKGGVASLHTPSPGTPKALAGGTFGGGNLEGLMQPSQLLMPQGNGSPGLQLTEAGPRAILMPQTNGGLQLSEAGPIRTIVRQAAKERPSPVAMDGKT